MSDSRPVGLFGPNPEQGEISSEQIKAAARELREAKEAAEQHAREASLKHQYEVREELWVLLKQACDEPPLWTCELVAPTAEGLMFSAHGPTSALALQRMHWAYAMALMRRTSSLQYEEARHRAARCTFLDAGL